MQQNQVGQDFAAFPLGSVLCHLGLLYKIPPAGWLKQQKVFHRSGGWEGQHQGASRIGV